MPHLPIQSRRSMRTLAMPPRAVVTLAALDLRRDPDHASELTSQLLLGEIVRVLEGSADRPWWRVENEADRYTGWCRTWGLVGCSVARARRWRLRARGRVIPSHAEVRAGAGTGPLVSPLFWNARLIVGRALRGFRPAELPDGRRGFVAARDVSTGPARPKLMTRIGALLGVPYLWGGRTALGLDCSALTQQLLEEQGVSLPRDARDQFSASRPVPASRERIGDLAFFGNPGSPPGHVGLALGGGYYVHARGWVRIQSVVPGNPLYDKDLSNQFRGFRRPLGGGPRRPRTTSRTRESA